MKNFLLAFIPIFVAVDVVGILPIFVSFTQNLSKEERRKIITQSLLTALGLALGFIFLGKIVFRLLSITISDFMIAGGIILFCIAVIDLLTSEKRRRMPKEELGVVPIGTPLIVGPAVLTTSLMLIDQYGILVTMTSVVINLIIVGLVFNFSNILVKIFGKAGSRALSKIMALLLAAIAVMMVRKGFFILFNR